MVKSFPKPIIFDVLFNVLVLLKNNQDTIFKKEKFFYNRSVN